MNWFISLFKTNKAQVLRVGATVKLPYGGTGVVTGGAVHVDVLPSGTYRVNYTFNLDNVEVVQ